MWTVYYANCVLWTILWMHLAAYKSTCPFWTSLCLRGKEPNCKEEDRFSPWLGKIPWRRAWKLTQLFLPAQLHRQKRNLAGYSPLSIKESDTTKWLTFVVSQVEQVVKNLPAKAEELRDVGSIPEWGRCHGGEHGNPLHYTCLKNPHGQRSLGGFSP